MKNPPTLTTTNKKLVGGFNPIEKYARQNGNSSPIFGLYKNKCLRNHQPEKSDLGHKSSNTQNTI